MKLARLFAIAGSLFAVTAFAQEMGPPPELSKLNWQLGEWSATVVWTMQGMEGEA